MAGGSFRLGVSSRGVHWKHIHGAGWLAGIGFTMSLFMAGLYLMDNTALAAAELGILAESLCSVTIGSVILASVAPRRHKWGNRLIYRLESIIQEP